jgi:hypothetical protein
LGGSVNPCLLGLVGRRRRSLFELIGLNFNGGLWRGLGVGILQEEVKIGLYLWIGCGLDIVRSHLFLIFAEIGKLIFHILMLKLFLLPVNIELI